MPEKEIQTNTRRVIPMNTIINALRHQIERDNNFWKELLNGLDEVEGDDKIFLCFLLTYIGHNRTAKMLYNTLQGFNGLLSSNKVELKKKLKAFVNNRQGKRFGFHHKFLPTRNCRVGFIKGILDFRAFAKEARQEHRSLRAYLDCFDTFDDLFRLLLERRIKYLDKALHVFDFMETLYRATIFSKRPERMYLKERLNDGTGLGPIGNGLSYFYIGRKLPYSKKAIKIAYAEHYGIREENVPEKINQLGLDLQRGISVFFKNADIGELVFVLETLLCVYQSRSSNMFQW